MKIFLTSLSIIIFFIFFNYSDKIAKKLNFLDKKKIPLIGGIFLYLGFLINFFYLNEDLRTNIYLIDLYFLSSIFFCCFTG